VFLFDDPKNVSENVGLFAAGGVESFHLNEYQRILCARNCEIGFLTAKAVGTKELASGG
jgi:nitrogen regulatory protein PII-like uncharacterized protein